jgi:hypothetical protein
LKEIKSQKTKLELEKKKKPRRTKKIKSAPHAEHVGKKAKLQRVAAASRLLLLLAYLRRLSWLAVAAAMQGRLFGCSAGQIMPRAAAAAAAAVPLRARQRLLHSSLSRHRCCC